MPPKVCGNPMFRDWLDEARQTAQDKGLKTAETYGKAIKSLNACPVKYDHPSELICLTNIGPKIVELLTRKMRIYCDDNDIEMPATPQKKRKTAAKAAKATQPTRDDDSDSDEVPAAPAKKAKKVVTAKTYIPARRSGPYGILLGLLAAIDEPTRTTNVFLTKPELVRVAQPHCDTSYTHSDKGTFFTAWNGTKSLVTRGYVYQTGMPAKYCLTEDGYNVAVQMRSQIPEYAHMEEHPWIDDVAPALALTITAPARPRPAPREIPLGRPESSQQGMARSRPSLDPIRRESNPGRFQFWYIDNTGQRVPTVSQANLRLDPEDFVNMRKIEFRHALRTHPFARQLKLVDAESRVRDESGEATYFGFTAEEGAPPNCSKFDEAAPPSDAAGGSGQKRRRSGSIESDGSLDIEDIPASARPPPKKTANELFAAIGGGGNFARTQSAPVHINSPLTAQLAAEAAARRMGGLGATSSLSSIAGPSRSAAQTAAPARPAPRLSSHIPIQNPLVPVDPNAESAKIPDFDPATQGITWPAGSYDIVLIVDDREVESTKSRDKFKDELRAKGVNVETRSLKLGDMIWIARLKDGMGGDEDECVLDYVVERKRLDDLINSISDGRYNEQCFRLGNSSIQHVYYIVEEFQTAARMEVSGMSINTVKSQVQVHSRFFLKETHKLSETIDFLKTMTQVIISTHAQTDLRIIPSRFVSRATFCALQNKLRTDMPSTGKEAVSSFLTTYADHTALNDKSSCQTLKEKFARMMLTTKGMSAERVSSLLDVWDTPRAMWEDLKAHNAIPEEEVELGKDGKPKKKKVRGKDMFFADRVPGEGRRKIGDALSRTLYRNLMNIEDD